MLAWVLLYFKDGPFAWEKEIQGHILGAFFYGYLVSQIPGGLLAERFGGKWILTIFLGISTVATLLTPLAAQQSVALLIVLRVLVGIGSVSFTFFFSPSFQIVIYLILRTN